MSTVTIIGGELPLGGKLPEFEFRTPWGRTWKLTSGPIELHRLVVEDPAQLKRRKEEITVAIVNATCSLELNDGYVKELYKEVRKGSPPKLLPRSHHCFSPAPSMRGTGRSCC